MPQLEAPLIGIDRHRLATDGDGITTLVAFHECPLRCAYCINAQCFKESPECKLTVDKLIERLMPDNIYFLATGGGVTFGGGEPLLYADFISEFTRKMPEEWKITIESSLNVPNKNIFKVAQFADLLVIDIKDMDEFIYKQYTGKDNSFVLANLKWLVDNGYANKTIIRIPLIKNYNRKITSNTLCLYNYETKSRSIFELKDSIPNLLFFPYNDKDSLSSGDIFYFNRCQ